MIGEPRAIWSKSPPKRPYQPDTAARQNSRSQKSVPGNIPYSREALRADLDRVRAAWVEVQSRRDRSAIYIYLDAVWALGAWWHASREKREYAWRARRLSGVEGLPRENLFGTIIRCTADPAKVDKRTRSKWSRLLSYVNQWKLPCDTVGAFVLSQGGINSVAQLAAYRRAPD